MAVSRKKKKQPSCGTLRRRAKKIRNPRKRRKALSRLPKRCKVVPVKPPTGTQPSVPMVPSPGTPPPVPPPAPPPPQAPPSRIDSPIPVLSRPFTVRDAERLLWRAGFGPRPGQAAEVARLGLEGAVLSLTRPSGEAVLEGAPPTVGGEALDPYGTWGHDHLYWLDRMVRSSQPLIERLALVLHDWFGVSNDAVGSVDMMFEHVNLFRAQGLGSFKDLLRAVTVNRAMLVFLSGIDNRKGAINENYAREVMELFGLGADRGAYTETDVRELARALSGWRADWVSGQGFVNFRWDERRWDNGTKTVFGKSGAFGWEDAVDLVVAHPMHPSFFVRKLWSYFIPVPPSADVQAALERRYVASGHQVLPVLEAILCAPQLYDGPAMVKPPVVFEAGLLRATGRTIDESSWEWLAVMAGQRLFFPPDVSGWDDTRWLDTSTMRGRWEMVNTALKGHTWTSATWNAYPAETAEQAVATARAFWNDPALSPETAGAIGAWAAGALGAGASASMRGLRQNALRMLIGMSPDHHCC